jgi:hypothetical protein
MRKLRPSLPLVLLVFCALSSAVAVQAAPQVLRDAAPYSGAVHKQRPANLNPHIAVHNVAHPAAKASSVKAFGFGTGTIQADWNGFNDKQRTDGASAPLLIVLTNVSEETTVNFTNITFNENDSNAYTATMTCATLAPGQTCNVLVSFATTSACEAVSADFLVNDDDPEGGVEIALAGYGADNAIQVDDLTDAKLTATALAQSLVGAGVTVSNVSVTGAARAIGNFTSSSNVVGFKSGVVLSTGSVRNVVGPNCSTGIDGENGTAGDTDLDTLVGDGNQTNDAAVLEFDFVPTSSTLSFEYTFASDEYNEFVGQFNDVFGFFLNGTNIALIPGTNTPVAINNVNGGNPLGTDPVNAQYYINNDFQFPAAAPVDTEMDGLTVVLTAAAKVNPNVTNHIKLAIADAIDDELDSNVFLEAGSFTSSDATLTPASQNFGSVAVGSSSPAFTFTLSNVGSNSIDLGGIALTGPFTETDNCDDGLNPLGQDGSTCTIQVTFTPTASGAATGTLTATYNTVGSNTQQTVSSTLTGTGTGGGGGTITVSPTSLTFTTVIGTTSAAQAVTITNTGTTAVTVSSVTVPGGGAFAQTNNCASIAASATCTINVTFAPTGTEPVNGNLTINDNAAGSPHTVALSGTGVNSPIIISIPSGGSASATSVPGGTAYYGLLITAVPGFSGTVTLSCTPSSPTITCTPVPSTITLGAGGTTEVAFGIQTYCKGTTVANGGVPGLPDGFGGGFGLGGFGGGLALFALALSLSCATWTFHRKPRVAVAFAGVLAVILIGAACGGSPAKGPNGVTPAGTYTLTLNATINGNTVSLPNYLTLVVK